MNKVQIVVGIPMHGSIKHIVRGPVKDHFGDANARSVGRALCGVAGSNGWWRNGFRVVDQPIEEAECKKCLKIWQNQ